MMAKPGLGQVEVKSIINSGDGQFENQVTKLSMRELLDLVTGIQQAMAVEQSNFDRISVQLSSNSKIRFSKQHEKMEEQLKEAKKKSQTALATLCSRNMRCFTQQSVQAKHDQAKITSQTIVSKRGEKRMKMPVKDGKDVDSDIGDFRQRLAFFQNRTEPEKLSADVDKIAINVAKKTMVPNVDDVLLSVKLLRESQKTAAAASDDVTEGGWTGDDVTNDDYEDHDSFQQIQFNHYEKLFNAHNDEFNTSDHYDVTNQNKAESGDDTDLIEEVEEEEEEEDDYSGEERYHQQYIYHGNTHEDNGLEVILEEDEESVINKDDYGDQISKLGNSNQTVDCDSGVTDDQRSNSTGDELDSLTGDTDSAKGSMIPDIASQTSPTSSLDTGKDVDLYYQNSDKQHKEELKHVHFEAPKMSVSEQVDRIFKSCDIEASSVVISPHQSISKHSNNERKNNFSSNEWDSTAVLKELYSTKFPEVKHHTNTSAEYINIEGYLEKLPSGRKKATFWNPWKRKYFKACDGYLYYYEQTETEKETICLQLMGGNVDTLDNNMIGVDDGKGHYLVMKCANKEEINRWHRALLSHCMENFILTYVQPVEFGLRSHQDVVVIDLGSCSVRAGILAEQPTLPQLFFPAVCATDIKTGKKIFGVKALSPEVRKVSTVSFPLCPQQSKFTIDMESFPALIEKIFNDLNVDPTNYRIQFSVSRKYSMQTLSAIARIMFDRFNVDGVNMTQQSVSALYSYNSTSGIIVDLGNRLDILPIIDGYIVDSGVTRTPYGGQRIIHHLKQELAQKQYSFESDAESCLVRYALEQLCFVAQDFKSEMNNFQMDPDSLEKSVSLADFKTAESELVLDSGRFSITEGLFNPELWGLDLKGLHKLVHKAIMECSMDARKEMTKSIYLCGGISMIPGLADRLQKELDKLTPPSLTPKVHSSPYRYHSSYIGACILASNPAFPQVMVSSADWKQCGNACLSKWHL